MRLKIEGRRDAVWDYYRIGRCLERKGGRRGETVHTQNTLTDG